MTNGELFIVENPNIEFKLNSSCVWIYFDGVNHYTMPISWWNKEIKTFEDIKAEIEGHIKNVKCSNDTFQDFYETGERHILEIIDKHISGKE